MRRHPRDRHRRSPRSLPRARTRRARHAGPRRPRRARRPRRRAGRADRRPRRSQRMSVQREVDLSGHAGLARSGAHQQRGRRHRPRRPRAARHRGPRRRRARPARAARAAAGARARRERAAAGRSAARHRSRARTSSRPPTTRSRRSARRSPTATTPAARFERAQQLSGARPAHAGRPRHRRDAAQGRRGELPGRARQRPQPQGEPAGSPRLLRAGAEEARRRRRSRRRSPASISERLVQPGEFIRENTPVVTIVQMNPLKLKTAIQEKHASLITAGPDGRVRRRGVPGPEVRGQDRLRQPGRRSDDADLPGRSAGRERRPAAEARVLRQGRRR